MFKNVPLLITLIAFGNGTLLLAQSIKMPDIPFWFLLVLSIVLNAWGIIGLLVHFWVRNVNRLKEE